LRLLITRRTNSTKSGRIDNEKTNFSEAKKIAVSKQVQSDDRGRRQSYGNAFDIGHQIASHESVLETPSTGAGS